MNADQRRAINTYPLLRPRPELALRPLAPGAHDRGAEVVVVLQEPQVRGLERAGPAVGARDPAHQRRMAAGAWWCTAEILIKHVMYNNYWNPNEKCCVPLES